MGVFFGVISGSFDTKSAMLSIAVVDEDNSEMSARFVRALEETGNIHVQKVGRDVAMDQVRRGQKVGMIAIPPGFGKTAGIFWLESPAIEVGMDPSRKAEAGMLQGLILQSMGRLIAFRFTDAAGMRPFVQQARDELAKADNIPPAVRPIIDKVMDALDSFVDSWEIVQQAEQSSAGNASSPIPELELARINLIDVTRQLPKDSPAALVQQLRSNWDISFPQAMLWGVLGCAASFAVSIVRERKQGTFLRLQVAPITRGQILAGKAAACFFAVITVIVLMWALGTLLGMRPRNPAMFGVAAICVAWCFVGVMMLMSVIGKSEEAVSGASWGANLMMAMFGGGMIPLAFMPGFMKSISHASPVKWSILAIEGAVWRGFTWSELILPCGVLVAIGAVCMTIGIVLLSRAD
jgi:ABC-2 type transport system permease protein